MKVSGFFQPKNQTNIASNQKQKHTDGRHIANLYIGLKCYNTERQPDIVHGEQLYFR